MPERPASLVINTSPLLVLVAASGGLEILRFMYSRVVVPLEVAEEIRAGGPQAFGLDVFNHAEWLEFQEQPVSLQPLLQNSLDRGEASVIQTALNLGLPLVCIDETAGRRIARLCELNLTGSVGILVKASRLGYPIAIPEALQRMRQQGIWLSDRVVEFALSQQR
jgi:predicted nucleic acid-binding protein